MAIELGSALAAGEDGPWVHINVGGKSVFPNRIVAVGGFSGDVVTVVYSPTGLPDQFGVAQGTVNEIVLGTLANEQELIINGPVNMVRAKAGAALVGSADVYLELAR